MATGLASVCLVTTAEANVLVDTGFGPHAARQQALLRQVSDAPVRYIFLSQGQQDDIGGIEPRKDAGTRTSSEIAWLESELDRVGAALSGEAGSPP